MDCLPWTRCRQKILVLRVWRNRCNWWTNCCLINRWITCWNWINWRRFCRQLHYCRAIKFVKIVLTRGWLWKIFDRGEYLIYLPRKSSGSKFIETFHWFQSKTVECEWCKSLEQNEQQPETESLEDHAISTPASLTLSEQTRNRLPNTLDRWHSYHKNLFQRRSGQTWQSVDFITEKRLGNFLYWFFM